MNVKGYYGRTSLHEAAWHGRENVVKFLLRNGVDVSSVGMYGWTQLYLAVDSGHLQTVNLKS